jgi:hypothetical protein
MDRVNRSRKIFPIGSLESQEAALELIRLVHVQADEDFAIGMKGLAPMEVQVWRCRCKFGYEHNDSDTSLGSVKT